MDKFIREQIKDKPSGKKPIWERMGIPILNGFIIGIVAAGVFTIVTTQFDKSNSAKEVDTQISLLTTEDLNENTEDTEEISTETVISDSNSKTIINYQKLEDELYDIGKSASDSIVTITSVTDDKDWFNKSYEAKGSQTGIIVSTTGANIYILAEKNELDKAKKITVIFEDNSIAEATIRSYDGNTGFAILSVSKGAIGTVTNDRISAIELGNSNRLNSGNLIIELGGNNTISTGTITSISNEVNTIDKNYSLLTTDIISANNGNGFLVNTDGKLVGVEMQKYGLSDANTVTALAISDIDDMIQKLLNGKSIPYMGVTLTTVSREMINEYNMPHGVYISKVEVDSPALNAGLQNGDVITEINGVTVNDTETFSQELQDLEIGEKYSVRIERRVGKKYKAIAYDVEIGVLD